jgi:hypothetical protein
VIVAWQADVVSKYGAGSTALTAQLVTGAPSVAVVVHVISGPLPVCATLVQVAVGTYTSPLSTLVQVVVVCVTPSTAVPSVHGATGSDA